MKTSSNQNAPNPWIAGAQYLAFVELNNDSSILPDYELRLHPYNDEHEISKAIVNTIKILQNVAEKQDVTFPIVLGMQLQKDWHYLFF